MVFTFCTGARVMRCEVSVRLRRLPSGACSRNACDSPSRAGASAALSAATSAPFATSMPSISSSRVPRPMPAAAAGEPG